MDGTYSYCFSPIGDRIIEVRNADAAGQEPGRRELEVEPDRRLVASDLAV